MQGNKNLSDRVMERLELFYQKQLSNIANHPKILLGGVVILFSLAVFTLTTLGGEFIPTLEEGDFAVESRVLTGSNLNTTIDATQKASKILLEKFPEVEKIVTKIGSGEIPIDPMAIETGDMMIILKDKSKWVSATTFNQLAEKMGKELEVIPGLTTGFQFPVQMRFNELMTGARQDVVCKIFGQDIDSLAMFAKQLGATAATINGAKDIYVEPVGGMPQIIITYNRAAIAQYGLNINTVNKVINAAFAGQGAGLVFEGEKRFDIVVRLQGNQRQSIANVEQLLIPTANGTQVPLYQLATIKSAEGPNQIQRENAKRRIVVGFNVRGRDVQSIVTELQQKVGKNINLPHGYTISYGGAFENLNAAKKRLSIAVPVSLLLIFLMLYFAFKSVKQGLLIYTAIPLSAIGGIFALALRGMPFSISAGIGFIALFGVAVLNGIVLIAEFNRLKAQGITNLKTIVLQGSKTRLRPVLMTAFVASLGFLPMALSNGAGAEVQRPLATVVIGGLLIATLLTLFVLPVLYMLFERGLKIGKPNKGVTATAVLLFAFIMQGSAQQPIALQAAIDSAFKNNPSLQLQALQIDYLDKMQGTAYAIQPTVVGADVGQINSIYTDNRVSISQNIKFPTVYSRQKQMLTQEYKGGTLALAVKQNDVKAQVTTAYYGLLFLDEKKKLLQRADSLFIDFLTKSNQRFNAGESNILEKTTAENQRGKIDLQLKQLQHDYAIQLSRFNFLIGAKTQCVPSGGTFKIAAPALIDTTRLIAHPAAKYLKQQQQISMYKIKADKARLLPDISIGYSNMSIRGTGADDKIYNASTRFSAVQFGLGLPLFFGAQKAQLKADKIDSKIAAYNYSVGITSLQNAYAQALANYSKNLVAVNYYENNALQNAKLIITTAGQQLQSGSINYLDWVMLVNQAIGTQAEYIDAVNNLNVSIIELNALSNN